jgi:hypothetical protein
MFTFASTILGVSAVTLVGDALDALSIISSDSVIFITYQTEDVRGQDNYVVSPYLSETP